MGHTGLPLVTSTITIASRKSTIERGAGAPPSAARCLLRWEAHDRKLTLRGGTSTDHRLGPINDGSGVLNHGSLTLTDCTVSGNTASGCSSRGCQTIGSGGGVFNSGTLTVTNSTVWGNTARNRGGGVLNSGTVTIRNSRVSGNAGGGGGVVNSYGAPSPSGTAPSRAMLAAAWSITVMAPSPSPTAMSRATWPPAPTAAAWQTMAPSPSGIAPFRIIQPVTASSAAGAACPTVTS